ncbi:MAG: SoxY-related AACIE arm protein [Burkholderiales bacterium]
MKRRDLLAATIGLTSLVQWRPAGATAAELAAAITAFAAGAPVRAGRVDFDIAPLVENGNVVPITVRVQSPMTEADHVKAIAIFNESNPQRDVANFFLGPRAGRATVSTRIRLATSQQLVAVAKMNDGSCWSQTVDVLVTLAACVEP